MRLRVLGQVGDKSGPGWPTGGGRGGIGVGVGVGIEGEDGQIAARCIVHTVGCEAGEVFVAVYEVEPEVLVGVGARVGRIGEQGAEIMAEIVAGRRGRDLSLGCRWDGGFGRN